MEDDRHILAVLSCQDRARRGGGAGSGGGGEVVLSPSSLTGKNLLVHLHHNPIPFHLNVCFRALNSLTLLCLLKRGVPAGGGA